MTAGDIRKVTCFYDFQGNLNNINTFYIKTIVDPPTADPDNELLTYFEDVVLPALVVPWVNEKVYKCIESQLILRELVRDIVPGIADIRTVNITGGETLSGGMPGQCSMVIQELPEGNLGDPSKRGRGFWTGFPEDDHTSGSWTEASFNAFATGLAGVLLIEFGGSFGGQYQWGTWSETLNTARKAETEGPPWIDPWTRIQSLRGLRQVRTQRRRQPENPCDRYFPIIHNAPAGP